MFVAVVPPMDAVQDLAEFVEPRREHNAVARKGGRGPAARTRPDESPLRWTAEEHWHLTLAFLPVVPEAKLDDLIERLSTAAAKRTRFELQLAGAGTYPNPVTAKVLWTGVHGNVEELSRLSVGARNAASASGIGVEGADFQAHLTLARVNRPTELGKWLQVFDTYSGPSWPVDEMELIESHLGQGPHGRPRYQSVAAFPLS
jgi:2'-5' RNA ligase